MMLRAPLRAAAVGGVSGALLAALTLEESVFDMSDARRDVYVRKWAGSLLRLMGIEITPRPPIANVGGEPATTGPLLVVANHRSTLDILLMLHLFGGHLLARGDMATWPGVGALARSGGTLFVDRSSPASGAVAVRRMRERLQRRVTVGVFPKGRRSTATKCARSKRGHSSPSWRRRARYYRSASLTSTRTRISATNRSSSTSSG